MGVSKLVLNLGMCGGDGSGTGVTHRSKRLLGTVTSQQSHTQFSQHNQCCSIFCLQLGSLGARNETVFEKRTQTGSASVLCLGSLLRKSEW